MVGDWKSSDTDRMAVSTYVPITMGRNLSFSANTIRAQPSLTSGERSAQKCPKIEAENPNRYLLVTSQALTPNRKRELMEILGTWIQDPADIVTQPDLNGMIDRHRQVELSHFKLWLASAGVLERIVQSGLWARSEALLEDVKDRVRLYVDNRSYALAADILARKHYVVITGQPGVGKSMLAEMLTLTHWEHGWQVVNVGYDVERAWDAWVPDRRQIFYIDDGDDDRGGVSA
jgi:hypothetical protein